MSVTGPFWVINKLLTALWSISLSALGRQVGDRFGELFVIRDRNNKRELKPINQLIQIQTNLWKVRRGRLRPGLTCGLWCWCRSCTLAKFTIHL